jgi:hypothetical protein
VEDGFDHGELHRTTALAGRCGVRFLRHV